MPWLVGVLFGHPTDRVERPLFPLDVVVKPGEELGAGIREAAELFAEVPE